MPGILNIVGKFKSFVTKVICYQYTLSTIIILLIPIVLGVEILMSLLTGPPITKPPNNNHSDHVITQFIIEHTHQASIIFMIVTFLYLSLRIFIACGEEQKNKAEKQEDKAIEEKSRFLSEILKGSLAAGAIPPGISLAVGAFFDVELIKNMKEVDMYIAFSGLSIIAVGLLATLQEQDNIREGTNLARERVQDVLKKEDDNSKET